MFDEAMVQSVQDLISLCTPSSSEWELCMDLATDIAVSPTRASAALLAAGRLIRAMVKVDAQELGISADEFLQGLVLEIMGKLYNL
jgi:hypothetical protein